MKKLISNNDNEINRLHAENKIMKTELHQIKDEHKNSGLLKEKIIVLEKTIMENQKIYASSEMQISYIQSEKEKVEQEVNRLKKQLKDQTEQIDDLELNLVKTKEQLGEAINDVNLIEIRVRSEYTNSGGSNVMNSPKANKEKKSVFSGLFSSKKDKDKDKDKENKK